jgi:hypothetical protein
MAYFQPISFSPGNPFGEALQETTDRITQMKAVQREEMKALVDVSLEGVMLDFQDEVSKDVNQFKTDAARIYSEQGRFGKPLDFKEYAKLQTKKKTILAKVNHARMLTDAWQTTITEAAKLKADPVRGNILDDSTEPALEAWKNDGKGIWDKTDPRSLVRRRYGMQEMTADYDAITKQTKESAIKSPQSVINKAGKEERRIIYDPMQQEDAIWQGAPQIANFWVKEAGGDERKGREMFDQWLKNQSIDALDLQGGGTHVYNYMGGFGGEKDKGTLYPYKNPQGKIAYNFESEPMELKSGKFIGRIGQIARNDDGTWDKVISQVMVEQPDGTMSVATADELANYISMYEKQSGGKVSRTERGELVLKLTPADVNQLAWLPFEFKNAEQYGLSFQRPEEPIEGYNPFTKSKREIKEEAQRIVSKKTIRPTKTTEEYRQEAKAVMSGKKPDYKSAVMNNGQTKISTPDGVMTVDQLMKEKDLTREQIIGGIERGTISLSK